MTTIPTMHGPHLEPLVNEAVALATVPVPYAPRPIQLEVTTLVNGVYATHVDHDDLIMLVARHGDGLLDEGARPHDDLEFLATRVVLSHLSSDRDTGSSVQTWPWPHDLVDEVLRRALNKGIPVREGAFGPYDDGTFHDVTKVVTTLPEI